MDEPFVDQLLVDDPGMSSREEEAEEEEVQHSRPLKRRLTEHGEYAEVPVIRQILTPLEKASTERKVSGRTLTSTQRSNKVARDRRTRAGRAQTIDRGRAILGLPSNTPQLQVIETLVSFAEKKKKESNGLQETDEMQEARILLKLPTAPSSAVIASLVREVKHFRKRQDQVEDNRHDS